MDQIRAMYYATRRPYQLGGLAKKATIIGTRWHLEQRSWLRQCIGRPPHARIPTTFVKDCRVQRKLRLRNLNFERDTDIGELVGRHLDSKCAVFLLPVQRAVVTHQIHLLDLARLLRTGEAKSLYDGFLLRQSLNKCVDHRALRGEADIFGSQVILLVFVEIAAEPASML